ncbi:MAG: DUF4145 domain-containing protein [Gammaproteobacteria bacterium]|nr:DUF4145 domain-containing protein [Gammaproteobacteria bacterium]
MGDLLALDRCPHCEIAKPLLAAHPNFNFMKIAETANVLWTVYVCTACNNVATAKGSPEGNHVYVDDLFPKARVVDTELPEVGRTYLQQAHRSLGDAPDGAAMLASSSIEAMIKDKGVGKKREKLTDRINQAVEDGLITKGMGDWAHKVRLEANDPRHADEAAPHVTREQATVLVEFAETLGHILYVLPSLVAKGISDANEAETPADER